MTIDLKCKIEKILDIVMKNWQLFLYIEACFIISKHKKSKFILVQMD